MAGTFTQLHIQIVFAVKYRMNLLKAEWRQEVFKYMSGIVRGLGHKSIIINGVSDHVHLFVGLKPVLSISDLVRDVKNNSTNFINDRNLTGRKFQWQGGYGAFSYSHSDVEAVYNYILNQEKHHSKKSFKDEYLSLLKKFEIQYDERYLFEWYD